MNYKRYRKINQEIAKLTKKHNDLKAWWRKNAPEVKELCAEMKAVAGGVNEQ